MATVIFECENDCVYTDTITKDTSSEIIRPAVANIDQALVIFSIVKPQPNFNLLDRFLCMMEYQKVPVTICFNKCDLVSEEQKQELEAIYKPAGYDVIFSAARKGFSGQVFDEELLKPSRAHCPWTRELLSYIDILVDGEFKIDLKDITLRFKGS